MPFFIGFLVVLIAIVVWRQMRRNRPARAPKPATNFDRTEGQPDVPEAIAMLGRADWEGLSRLYRRLPPSDRAHMINGLGARAGSEAIQLPANPDSAALVIAGGLHVVLAAQARGGGIGADVSDRAAMSMVDYLTEARRLLTAATAIAPHDSTAYAFDIRCEMGLGGDRARFNGFIGRLQASSEHNLYAAAAHLQFVAPKWHGSITEMWSVANDYATRGPNPAWLAIAARAHIEEWLFCTSFDPSQKPAYIARLRDDGFIASIRELDTSFWSDTRLASMTPAEATFAHNNFAFLHTVTRTDDLIARHLEAMGPRIAMQPWGYDPTGVIDPVGLINTLRRKAGLPALAA